jgi:osmotically inducible lipoprotein OsmB
MQAAFKAGIIVLSLSVTPLSTEAGTLEGAGIGAGGGAVVLGPVGAVAGGAIGAAVGGPNIVTGRCHYVRNHRRCWRDGRGFRHCARR